MMRVLAPLALPFLHVVTLGTAPVMVFYALLGLLTSPVLVPLLMFKAFVEMLIMSPAFLVTLPISIPVGGMFAFACMSLKLVKALFFLFTPLLWPLEFMCKWAGATTMVSRVMIMDTILPWLVPMRFAILSVLLPKAVVS